MIVGLLLWLSLWSACKQAETPDTSANTLTVRMPVVPSGLNPALSRDGYSSAIIQKIIPGIINFDPKTLELTPLLIDSMPRRIILDTGQYKGQIAYQFRFRKEAVWPDGRPITGEDYLFCIKVAKHPLLPGNAWQPVGKFIKDVLISPTDKRLVTVVITDDVPSIIAYIAGFELLPAHIYDPDTLLHGLSLASIQNAEKTTGQTAPYRKKLERFAKQFQSGTFARDPAVVRGAGPYRLLTWDDDHLVLVKKHGYWADSLPRQPILLAGYPDTIIYQIVLDETAMESMLKNRLLDLATDISADRFVRLQADSFIGRYYDFYTPRTRALYMLALNNRSPKLGRYVRKALAYAIDVGKIIDITTHGLAERILGPIDANSPHVHPGLHPLPYDPDKARRLLAADGWHDPDGDGILSKNINGQEVPLRLELAIPNTISFSNTVAILVKDDARKVGFDIRIKPYTWKQILQGLKSRRFEITLIRFSTPPGEYIPYSTWHSDNAGPGGHNFLGFANAEADAIINSLQTTRDSTARKALYYRFQEILFEEQPALFLFSPVKTIIVNHRWIPLISNLRPGYFENAFRLRKESQ